MMINLGVMELVLVLFLFIAPVVTHDLSRFKTIVSKLCNNDRTDRLYLKRISVLRGGFSSSSSSSSSTIDDGKNHDAHRNAIEVTGAPSDMAALNGIYRKTGKFNYIC